MKKLFVIGLLFLLVYTVLFNSAASRILFSNRPVFSKCLVLSGHLVTTSCKLFWKTLVLLFKSLQFLGNLFLDCWHALSGSFTPSYDIRSYAELYSLYQRIAQRSGLPWQVFWGIHAEETDLGKNLGSVKVIRVLPANQKRYFFQICRELQWDPTQIYGSHKGAIGPFQFIPETWVRYAVDGDGDGRKDPFDLDDAAYSAANYLLNKGGLISLSKALWHYNQDNRYVRRVMRYLRYS